MKEIFHQVSSYKVTSDFEGVRLDNCLISRLKGVPRTKIYSIIRKGELRVNKSTAKPAALSNDDIIATVVNQALDGDEGPLNELTDKVLRAKSKSLIMKINKGTAERPAMPDSNSSSANDDGSVETQLDNSTKEIINKESEGDLIERLVSEGIKGNMEEINSLENKVLRGKIKAAIVKAKRS